MYFNWNNGFWGNAILASGSERLRLGEVSGKFVLTIKQKYGQNPFKVQPSNIPLFHHSMEVA
jgi:hypothetical protein